MVSIMSLILLVVLILIWLALMEISLFNRYLSLRTYRPSPDVQIALNAMKNFGRFALTFGVLYWIQVQFGDAEPWFDAFQRN